MESALKIWHNSNFGSPAFKHEVKDVHEAKRLLQFLADYDLYQGETKVPYNAQGLEILEDGEWVEWSDEYGDDIHTTTFA